MDFLHRNMEVFAWSHEDISGINLEDIVYVMNVDPVMKLVK